MNELLTGLLSALLATNAPLVVSNALQQATGVSVVIADKNDPVEREHQRLLESDDEAQAAVQAMIEEADRQKLGNELTSITLRARIKEKVDAVRKAYDDFLTRHPNHARTRLAYGSFLNEQGEEQAAFAQWEKSRQLDPSNPAVWNNLANYFGHNGPVTNAFVHYARAIELNPRESLYYHNLATTVYLFRADATNFLRLTEAQVFERALALYRKAMELDPKNFELATEYAQSFYGLKTAKTGNAVADREAELQLHRDAMAAWRRAQTLARDDLEREGINLHFARLEIIAGEYPTARSHLKAVTNQIFAATKRALEAKVDRSQNPAATNAPAVTVQDK